jgi:hypothetical protein
VVLVLPGLGLVPGMVLELVTRGACFMESGCRYGAGKESMAEGAKDYIEARSGPRVDLRSSHALIVRS